MARYNRARWVGCNPSNFSTGKIQPVRFVVHVAQGSNINGLISWFNNPKAQVSAHFGNPRALFARMVQFVDTDETAWHCAQWNGTSIGCENIGYSGQPLSLGQKIRLRRLMKWLNVTHKIPLVYTGDPNVHGVIGHGRLPEGNMSHPQCPGERILVDVNWILHRMNRSKPKC